MKRLTIVERSYLECALWSTDHYPDGKVIPLRNDFDLTDMDEESMDRLLRDLSDFMKGAAPLLQGLDPEQVAFDFWLTRNRQGSGFWDGDYPESVADLLTEISAAYGEVDLYVGDDGKIYC